MSPRAVLRIARAIRADLGAHLRVDPTCSEITHAEYQELQTRSQLADQRLRYLVQHLESRHDAALLARACGAPGYINFR